MRKIAFVAAILFALAFNVIAQTEIRVGAVVNHTTNPAPLNGEPGGGDTFAGLTASAKFPLPKGFDLRTKAVFSRTPQLPSLFTTDEPEQKPTGEFRFAAEGAFNFNRFFVAGGFEAFNHFFPAKIDFENSYSRAFGFNPTASAGATFAKNHEFSATYLFKDNRTDLYGARANYFYTIPVKGNVSLRAGFEAGRFSFREQNRKGYRDHYYEHDNVFGASVEIEFKTGGYKHQ